MPRRVGRAHDLGQPLLALAVPVGAGQALALGPAAVAVHDDGDVRGEARCRRVTSPSHRRSHGRAVEHAAGGVEEVVGHRA